VGLGVGWVGRGRGEGVEERGNWCQEIDLYGRNKEKNEP